METNQAYLLDLLIESHSAAAVANINNISTNVFLNAFGGSGNFIQATAAALLSTGDLHAPITRTRASLRHFINTNQLSPEIVRGKLKLLGLGNSFYKDGIDPSFQKIYDMIDKYTIDNNLINDIKNYERAALKKTGKRLYANAAGITAYCCEILDLPKYAEIEIFLSGRIKGWMTLV